MEAPPSPLSSRPKRSVVEGSAVRLSALPNSPSKNHNPQTEVSSRPERSAVEGSAVRLSVLPNSPSKTTTPKRRCHPDRSVALWRALLFLIRSIESEWKRRPPLCHPDRSAAQWRDLRCACRCSQIPRLKPQPPNGGVIPWERSPFSQPLNWPSSEAAPPEIPPAAPLHASASHAAITA